MDVMYVLMVRRMQSRKEADPNVPCGLPKSLTDHNIEMQETRRPFVTVLSDTKAER